MTNNTSETNRFPNLPFLTNRFTTKMHASGWRQVSWLPMMTFNKRNDCRGKNHQTLDVCMYC